MKKIIALAVAACFATPVSASTISCGTLDASQSYATFTSCQVAGQGIGNAGQDNFANANAIVAALFADEGIVLDAAGSFAPGSGTGGEFFGSRPADGFEIADGDLNRTGFTFLSLPANTLFVSLKQANGFELFRVPDGGLPFTLTHMLNGNDTSHISTFAGISPVPLPAAGWLLLAGLGGLIALRRRP